MIFFKKPAFIVIALVALSTCVVHSQSIKNYDCCGNSYTRIDSALSCIAKYPYEQSSADKHLLLLAFRRSRMQQKWNQGWSIIEDQKIVKVAKQKYLLVNLSSDKYAIPKKFNPAEINRIVDKYQDEEVFFLIVNQVMVPFRHWASSESRDRIVELLRLGIGP